MFKRLWLLSACALSLSACMGMGAKPSAAFTAPPPPVDVVAPPQALESNGAIFQASNGYAGLVTGTRARSLGDMVQIVLIESTTTSKSTSGKTARDGSLGITPPSAGPLSFLDPNSLNAASQGSFSGNGTAAQQSQLNGTVAVTIAKIYPNGTAEVVGEKHMSLSQGKEWVQFSGRIRLVDIDANNRIASSQVANAQIIYTGNGAVQQASKPGWLSRFFNFISPF